MESVTGFGFGLVCRVVGAAAVALGVIAPVPALGQPVEWTLRASGGPSPREHHTMTYDAVRGRVVLFGGYNATGANGETWQWNGSAWSQLAVTGPASRWAHGMAYDTRRGVTVLFGGVNVSTGVTFGDTWEWDGTTWSERTSVGPSPRHSHAMAYDSARGVTVLFGGRANAASDGETWEWNGVTWTARAAGGPTPREQHAMTYDTARGVTVLFGGYSGEEGVLHSAETWEWNGVAWAQRIVGSPSPRWAHAMVYHADRGTTVLFGGYGGDGPNGETWEWDGTTWTYQAMGGPPLRHSHAMAYDSARRVTVLFGGSGNGDTWELHTTCNTPAITTQPNDQSVGVDQPVVFFVEAANPSVCTVPTPLAYQWQRRNPAIDDPSAPAAWADLADGGGFVNAHTPALVITRPTPGLASGYRCRITGGCGCEPGESGFIYTNTVNFSVACPADFNADGGIDGLDVEAFFERWENGC